jgi:hypothetical protein
MSEQPTIDQQVQGSPEPKRFKAAHPLQGDHGNLAHMGLDREFLYIHDPWDCLEPIGYTVDDALKLRDWLNQVLT